MSAPKYSRPEVERRWRVELSSVRALAGVHHRRIVDKYLDGGRLRLRRVEQSESEPEYKLGKKYRGNARPEDVVTIYLARDEYDVVDRLEGRCARKIRYQVGSGSLDVYEQPLHPFAIFEREFETIEEAAMFAPGGFAGAEVTDDASYSGYALADDGDPRECFDTLRRDNASIETAPDGSEVHKLLTLRSGSMASFRLVAGQASSPVLHRTVDEIWYVVSGSGEMWRRSRNDEQTVTLDRGICVTIPQGTAFQFRASIGQSLEVIAVTMPPWPGAQEAIEVEGRW